MGPVTVTPLIAGNQANGQVNINNAPAVTPVVAANATTLSIVLVNSGANSVRIGLANTVTWANGFLLPRYATALVTAWQGGVWAIENAGFVSVLDYIELRT